MIRKYLTMALRSMMRNKAYTFINILGLFTGVACCLLLTDYINDEGNHDQRPNLNNTYHATSIMTDEHEQTMPNAPVPAARRIKDENPAAAVAPHNVSPADLDQLVRYEDKPLVEGEGSISDSTMLDVITYHSRSRNPKKALV